MGLVFSMICSCLFCIERSMTWVVCSFFIVMVMMVAFMLAMYGITIGYHMAQKRMSARMEQRHVYADTDYHKYFEKEKRRNMPPGVRMPQDFRMPQDVAMPQGVRMMPQDVGIPQGPQLPPDVAMPQDVGMPQNVGMPQDARVPQDLLMPPDARPVRRINVQVSGPSYSPDDDIVEPDQFERTTRAMPVLGYEEDVRSPIIPEGLPKARLHVRDVAVNDVPRTNPEPKYLAQKRAELIVRRMLEYETEKTTIGFRKFPTAFQKTH